MFPDVVFASFSGYTFCVALFPVPTLLQELSRPFHSSGYSLYLVGGTVRDTLMARTATDWDVATDASPQQVSSLFRQVIPTGIQHGTVTIIFKGHHIECTTFRTESEYTDGRRPEQISFTTNIEDDLSRRDFTINAIAVSLPDGQIIDPFNGQKDIKNKIIRTVGNPSERFGEDGLRPLRAIRFATKLEFSIHEHTFQAINPSLHTIRKVSAERIRDELNKLLGSKQPSRGFLLLEKSGLLLEFLPELAACRGIDQKGKHRFDVLDHLLLTCDACPSDKLHLRLAGLFHDIGKPSCKNQDRDGDWTFYQHETISAKITRTILSRLKYPNRLTEQVCHLVGQHMFHYEPSWTDAAVRRFLIRVKIENLDDLFLLRLADARGTAGIQIPPDHQLLFRQRIDSVLEKQKALQLKDLAVDGKDLIELGIAPGPRIGQILKELFECVTEDPALNDKKRLLEIAFEVNKRYSGD